MPPSEADTLLAYKSIFGRANNIIVPFTSCQHTRDTRKMAKPREKVRNAMLHNYDSARYLASKVISDRFVLPRSLRPPNLALTPKVIQPV